MTDYQLLPTMQLQPCPLCGGDALYLANFYATHIHVACTGCRLQLPERPIAEVYKLRDSWNRRAEVKP